MRIFVCVLVLASASVAFAKSPLAAAPLPGTLVIASGTDGAEVDVDGEKVGMVPLPGPVPLAPGEHTIKVSKVGYAPLIDVFKIQKHKETHLQVDLEPVAGALQVSADIDQARVFIDGKFVCETPCTTEMPVGARAIQVSKGGYHDFFQNVSSVAGQLITLDVKMQELPAGLNPYKPPPPPPPKWFEKWWVWTAGAAGLAVVVTAIVVPVVYANQDLVANFHPSYTFTLGK